MQERGRRGRWRWWAVVVFATALLVCGVRMLARAGGVPPLIHLAVAIPQVSIVGLFRDNADYIRYLSPLRNDFI